MSSNIYVGRQIFHITDNLWPMFNRAFFSEDWYSYFQGMKVGEALIACDVAIIEMISNPEKMEKFAHKPEHGTFKEALYWLIDFRLAIANENYNVRISINN